MIGSGTPDALQTMMTVRPSSATLWGSGSTSGGTTMWNEAVFEYV